MLHGIQQYIQQIKMVFILLIPRIFTINSLLSIGVPDYIDYGLVNATNVSDEQIANITNFGNTRINLTLEGYAINRSDGLAMNCSLGVTKNISIMHEKYNLTSSNAGTLIWMNSKTYIQISQILQ